MPSYNPTSRQIANSFFQAVVEPLHGGRLTSLRTTAGELASPVTASDLSLARVPYRFGLLALQLWQDSYWHNDLCHRPWSVAAVDVTNQTIAISLTGDSALWQGVNVRRTFQVTDDPWIDVEHVLDPGQATGPYPAPAFWFSNTMSSRGRAYVPTPAGVCRVHALDGAGQLVGQALRTFRVVMRTGNDRWPIHFWSDDLKLPNRLSVRHLDAEEALGINAYFRLPPPPPSGNDTIFAADRLGLPYVIQASGWLYASGGRAPDGTGVPLSLTNGDANAAGIALDRQHARATSNANVLYYVLADDESDPPRSDTSFDPRDVDRFRMYLADLYLHSDVKLRGEWGAAATTLAGATPRSYADAVAAFAAGELTYAPWVDHRRFMMDLFSGAPADAREALRNGDPAAMSGTSGDGWTSVSMGRNWWRRGPALDFVGRYSVSTCLELKAVGSKSIVWTGYDDPDPIIRHRIWSTLGLGEDGMALFAESTLVNPDLSLPEVGRDLAAALLPLRRGIGGLFAASQPGDDGIYVLSSPESSAVLAIHGYESLGPWLAGTPPANPNLGLDAREGVHQLLASMGVGWSAISPEGVERGALEQKRARVLILPMCAALSDEACAAIERWVSAGGAVIADLLPGAFTAHGRLRASGIASDGAARGSTNPLDTVFAVVPGLRPPVVSTTVSVAGGGPMVFRCVDTVAAPSAAANASGTTPQGAPAWFTNHHGRGTAVYLGCSLFADYQYAASSPVFAEALRMEEAFAAALTSAGVEGRARVVDSSGERIGLCQVYVRRLGPAELVIMLRNYSGVYPPGAADCDGELRFHSDAHTYDLENGVYLGNGDVLSLRISPYTFRSFARLPYRVRAIDVRVFGARLAHDLVVTATVVADADVLAPHRLRFDVRAGDGAPIKYLGREVTADCGRATISIRAALNDPPGPWTVIVTDVMTGIQGEATVSLPISASPIPMPVPLVVEAIDD